MGCCSSNKYSEIKKRKGEIKKGLEQIKISCKVGEFEVDDHKPKLHFCVDLSTDKAYDTE